MAAAGNIIGSCCSIHLHCYPLYCGARTYVQPNLYKFSARPHRSVYCTRKRRVHVQWGLRFFHIGCLKPSGKAKLHASLNAVIRLCRSPAAELHPGFAQPSSPVQASRNRGWRIRCRCCAQVAVNNTHSHPAPAMLPTLHTGPLHPASTLSHTLPHSQRRRLAPWATDKYMSNCAAARGSCAKG